MQTVGPGMEANQRLKTAKFVASEVSTGSLSCSEVVHDLVGVREVLPLLEVALDEALHVGDARGALIATEDLQVNGREVMIGVGIELALKLGERLRKDLIPCVSGFDGPVDPSICGTHRLERPEHVVEGAVLHHEHDYVL